MLAATDPANPYGAIVTWPEIAMDAVAQRRRAGDPRERPDGLLRLARREAALRLPPRGRAVAVDGRAGGREDARVARARRRAPRAAHQPRSTTSRRRARRSRRSSPRRDSWRRRWACRCAAAVANMPEGDTIHRAARTLHAALAGRTVTRFETVFPQLARVDDDAPSPAHVERVEAAGKNLLMHFSGDLHLRTHMRMNGSWHIYRPGERWRMRRSDMRIVHRDRRLGRGRVQRAGRGVPRRALARAPG